MHCIVCFREMKHLTADLYICESCRHISSYIKPDPSIYDRSYTIKYGRYEHTKAGVGLQALRLKMLLHEHNDFPRRLLDYGCGVGSFVRYCLDSGLTAWGFDVNPYSDFCQIETLFKRHYNTVTFWDSLEHISDPVALIIGLNPEYIAVCTPCIDDFHLGLEHLNEWRHYMPQEHCHYFSEKSLRGFFELAGYLVTDVNYNESKIRTGGGVKNILSMGGVKNG